MKIEHSNLLKAVQQLVDAGYVIVQIKDLFEEDVFFAVYSFTPSEFNTASSVDYHSISGVNITEFLDKNVNFYVNPTMLVANFSKLMDEAKVVKMDVSKHCRWCKYFK